MSKSKFVLAAAGTVATAALLASFAVSALADQNNDNSQGKKDNTPIAKMMVQFNSNGKGQLSGTVAAMQSGSFTLNSWGGVWNINVASSTKIIRRFGGTSNLPEFAVGDAVLVSGTVSTTTSWAVNAAKVQNMSIQTRNASFNGTISNLSGSSFTLTTKSRGGVKVTVNTDARVMVNDKTGAVSDLANGMTATISGVWDRTQSTVMASKVVARTPKTPGIENQGEHSNATSTGATSTENHY